MFIWYKKGCGHHAKGPKHQFSKKLANCKTTLAGAAQVPTSRETQGFKHETRLLSLFWRRAVAQFWLVCHTYRTFGHSESPKMQGDSREGVARVFESFRAAVGRKSCSSHEPKLSCICRLW